METTVTRECKSCMGYGHINDETGEPTINRQHRKCLDCRGEGSITEQSPEYTAIWRAGCDGNRNNRRLNRTHKGERVDNPHQYGTDEWKAWNAGYEYQDMVSDG